jgi:DNA-binding NtrC family response regulator/tetratricopeptide (TPR) repeat protein
VDDLLADRFVIAPATPARGERAGGAAEDRWLDLATGRHVRLRIAVAGSRVSQLAWSDTCAAIARLRHPALNALIDFGCLGHERVFEAYDVGEPDRLAEAMAARTVEHAREFVRAHAREVDREAAALLFRRIERHARRPRGHRPVMGIVLQARHVFAAIDDALDDGTPGGVAAVEVAGPTGSGLTTTRILAARAARLAGYVPVSSGMLCRDPTIGERLRGRHVCVIVTAIRSAIERSALSAFVSQLGAESARRHMLLRFCRSGERGRGTIEVDPMSGEMLANMLYGDGDRSPDRDAVHAAARESDGWPGVFLDRLGVMRFDRPRSRISVARETSPAYVVSPRLRRRGIGRLLLDAPARGQTLARRGRHASAVRLLTRAGRVLEARHERGLAASCAAQLGWIERARGRSERALAAFARARDLGSPDPHNDDGLGVRAAIGAGVVWTDECRFAEAEAALRGASTAAAILGIDDVERSARRALARCLYWQQRHDEAAAVLQSENGREPRDAEDDALLARIAVAQNDLRLAIVSASRGLDLAERTGNDQIVASAARSMALALAALGSSEQAQRWTARGIQAAAHAHLPLMTLRFRAIELRTVRHDDRAAMARENALRAVLRRQALPALVRRELESACERSVAPDTAGSASCDRTLHDLESFLTLVHGESEDAAGLEAVCRKLLDLVRAATVQIEIGSPAPRTLARAGRPWQGDLAHIDRMLAGGPAPSDALGESRRAAEAIRFGQDAIAVVSCRWTPGTIVDRAAATAKLKAAALAAAPAVRSLLDRSHLTIADGIAGELIGSSPAAVSLRDAIARAARAPFPVLIEGESGSGKELVARAVHKMGSRRDRRLCALNCAALADDLLEAELFGHARGAFTGAVGERPGLFEEADGGTLFLDEVGELSPRAQAKLLRVLQDGEVRRVGENLPRRVDARIIAATNRRLGDEVDAGRFRADLRFRLDVVRLLVPSLRERASDIPALAAQFWSDAAGRVGSSATLTGDALAALARYDWPGNVRELQNALASMAVHAPRRGRVIAAMLPAHIARAARPAATSFEAAREDFERRYVRAALAQAAGHRSRAARALGVSRQGLAKMLRRLRISE